MWQNHRAVELEGTSRAHRVLLEQGHLQHVSWGSRSATGRIRTSTCGSRGRARGSQR